MQLLRYLLFSILAISFTNANSKPRINLQIEKIEAVNIQENSVSIKWSLNKVAIGQVEYGIDTSYGQMGEKENYFSLNQQLNPKNRKGNNKSYSTHIQYIYNLLPDTTYHYRVVTEDGNGKKIVSEDNIFKTIGLTSEPDIQAPIITLTGESTIELTKGSYYTELGATAIDNLDTNVNVIVSGLVDENTVGTYTITYTATDSAGNQAVITRTIVVIYDPDILAPIITLTGVSTIELIKGSDYTELGATAIDNIDANVAVTVSGWVDTNIVGTYIITYVATDSAGNKATMIRTVVVKGNGTDQSPIPAVHERTIPSPIVFDNVGDIKINSSHSDHIDWKILTGTAAVIDNYFGIGKGAFKMNQDHNQRHWITNFNLAKNIQLDTFYTVSWKQQATNENKPMTLNLSFVLNGTRGLPSTYFAFSTTSGTGVQTFYAVIKFNSKQWGQHTIKNIGIEMSNYDYAPEYKTKNNTDTGEGSVFIGDFEIWEGKEIPAPLRQTKAFGGSNGRIKISETGAWNIDGKDVFPMMLYTNAGRYVNNETENVNERYPEIVAHGFNGVNNDGFVSGNDTVTWNQHINSKAVKNNNIWFAIQLRSYLAKGEHLDWLDLNLKRLQDLNLMSHVKMWSIDNEMYTKSFPFWNEVKAIIDKYDPNGEIPFIMLDGNMLLGDNYPMINQTGAYLDFSLDGALLENVPESKGERLISQAFSGNHTASAGLIQINPGSDADLFAGILFGGIASGGTQMHHWSDDTINVFEGNYDTRMALKSWYAELPNYRLDIQKMLDKGIIQGMSFTEFKLDSADAKFTFGTKITLGRLAYLIIAANTLDNNTFTSTMSGLHYETSGRLINVLTGQLEGTLSDNSISIDIPGNGYKILFVEPSDKYNYSE